MQKWSPESLTDGVVESHFIAARPGLPTDEQDRCDGSSAQPHERRFHPQVAGGGKPVQPLPEPCDPHEILRETITAELADSFAARQRETETAYRERLAESEREREQAARSWREEFTTQWESVRDATLYDLAREASRLAVQMAEKIVRTTVVHDQAVLTRAIETVLHKVDAGVAIVVTAHPDDAARLAGDHALLARLRIAAVKEDRRLDPGGCLVAADRQEWDATIAKQLETLAEQVDEALAFSPATGEPEQNESPGVE